MQNYPREANDHKGLKNHHKEEQDSGNRLNEHKETDAVYVFCRL